MKNDSFQEIIRLSFRNLLRVKRVNTERLLEIIRKMNTLKKEKETIENYLFEINKALEDNEKTCSLHHGEEDCPDCGYSPKK